MSDERCIACELPLIPRIPSEHIQPAYQCGNPRCHMGGLCLTCQMLGDWFGVQDALLGDG